MVPKDKKDLAPLFSEGPSFVMMTVGAGAVASESGSFITVSTGADDGVYDRWL